MRTSLPSSFVGYPMLQHTAVWLSDLVVGVLPWDLHIVSIVMIRMETTLALIQDVVYAPAMGQCPNRRLFQTYDDGDGHDGDGGNSGQCNLTETPNQKLISKNIL